MKKILLTLLLAGMAECALGGYVVVTDTIRGANGSPATGGTIFITPRTQFVCSNGDQIYANITITAPINSLGVFSVTLCSNTTATPISTSYRISVQPKNGTATTETWVVPVTNPSHLPDVRTSPTPIPSFLITLPQITTSLNGTLRANGTGITTVSGSASDCVLVNGTSSACSGLSSIANNRVLGNVSGSTAVPIAITVDNIFGMIGSLSQGALIYRGASAMQVLGAGTSGQFLKTQGAGANPIWADNPGLSSILNNRVLGNVSGGSATPTGITVDEILGMIGTPSQGTMIFRGASAYQNLAPGTSGYFLQTQGAGANPVWAAVSSTSGFGITVATNTITVAAGTWNGGGTHYDVAQTVFTKQSLVVSTATGSNPVTLTVPDTAQMRNGDTYTFAGCLGKTGLNGAQVITVTVSGAPGQITVPVTDAGTYTANSCTLAGTGSGMIDIYVRGSDGSVMLEHSTAAGMFIKVTSGPGVLNQVATPDFVKSGINLVGTVPIVAGALGSATPLISNGRDVLVAGDGLIGTPNATGFTFAVDSTICRTSGANCPGAGSYLPLSGGTLTGQTAISVNSGSNVGLNIYNAGAGLALLQVGTDATHTFQAYFASSSAVMGTFSNSYPIQFQGSEIDLNPNATATIKVIEKAEVILPIAVGALPTCNSGSKGGRTTVTDSNAASFTAGIGAVVAAGGSTIVPVFCDGTNWRIG